MRRFLFLLSVVVALSLTARPGAGFSLLGPNPTWQTTAIGYVDFLNLPNPVSGGPMNLGEGYRWNVPTIYYSYSPDFLHYFGERGAAEVDKAIAIINALPSMSSVNVDDFPLQSQRINYQASALSLYDLKSVALGTLLEDLGLTDPTRFVFTLRSRFVVGNTTNYFVIRRNFDPVTFEPTSFINGQLWTYYNIIDPVSPTLQAAFVVPEAVDPVALGGFINAPVTADLAERSLFLGGFWTGLTRDDVGGLRYLYRESNLNVETAPPNASLFIPGSTTAISGSGSTSTSPWTIPNFPGAATNTGTVTPGTNIINQALRPGAGKVSFVRINYESLFGTYPSNNVTFSEQFFTNGVKREQQIVRPLTVPDILFDAQDLVGSDTGQNFTRTTAGIPTASFQSNDAINGSAGQDGPGQIIPGLTIILNKTGPTLANFTPAFLSEVNSTPLFRWGSFDGSTNAPFLYPNGATISALEDQALNGRVSGGASSTVSLVTPWTHADQVLFPPGTPVPGAGTGTGTGTMP